MALRMAVILCHARRDPDLGSFELNMDANRKLAKLKANTQWAEQWPQSAHLLREESVAWFKTGWELKIQIA
jgi:exopolyphosphatase/guanosine-5'-triphosphate,3'-diphosphate pyrophosphatase